MFERPLFRCAAIIAFASAAFLPNLRAQDAPPAAAPAAPAEPTTATPPAPAGKKLTVLVKPAKPFAFERGGSLSGYSIELWRRIAQETHLDFEFKTVMTVPEVITALKSGQADIGVGAISITAEREGIVDFSHPFYESGLQIMAPTQSGSSSFDAFKKLFTVENAKLLGVLALALIVISHLLWLLERRKNPESFPLGYTAGMWEAIWWSICTGITGGCENKAPMGVIGRLVAIVWMLAGMALVATVTANLASTMTVDNLVSDIKGLADLKKKKVATVTGTAAERYLSMRGLQARGYSDVETACNALATGEVDAVVYDAPILRYYLSEHPGTRLQLVGDAFDKQNYGFPMQQQGPYRKEINRALLKVAEEGYFVDLDKKWFATVSE